MTDLAQRGPLGMKPERTRKPGLRPVARGKRASNDCPIMRSAKGEACLADWCGCGGSNDTTVLCHVRKFGIGGMGMKPPNWIGFYGCAKAHQMFDHEKDAAWSWEGVMRAVILTQMKLRAKGLIGETR